MYISYDPKTNQPYATVEDEIKKNTTEEIRFDGVNRTLNSFKWSEKYPEKIISHTTIRCDEVGHPFLNDQGSQKTLLISHRLNATSFRLQ